MNCFMKSIYTYKYEYDTYLLVYYYPKIDLCIVYGKTESCRADIQLQYNILCTYIRIKYVYKGFYKELLVLLLDNLS